MGRVLLFLYSGANVSSTDDLEIERFYVGGWRVRGGHCSICADGTHEYKLLGSRTVFLFYVGVWRVDWRHCYIYTASPMF